MAITKSTDFQIVKMYTSYIQEAFSDELNLVSTGVVSASAEISGLASAEDYTGVVRYYGNVNGTINVQDESSTDAVPDKIATSTMSIVKTARDTSWSATDLSAVLANENALVESSRQAAFARAKDEQRNLLDIVFGVLSDNSTNDSADNITSIIKTTAGASAAGNKFGRDTLIDHLAKMEMGPADAVMWVSYNTWADFSKLDSGAANVRTSDNGVVSGSFIGVPFTVTNALSDVTATTGSFLNGLTATAVDSSKTIRTIYVLRRAGFAYSPIALPMPVETDRNMLTGKGSGTSTIVYRWAHALHPLGYDFTGSTTAFASDTTYKAAASWNRKWEGRKVQMISAVVYNG